MQLNPSKIEFIFKQDVIGREKIEIFQTIQKHNVKSELYMKATFRGAKKICSMTRFQTIFVSFCEKFDFHVTQKTAVST